MYSSRDEYKEIILESSACPLFLGSSKSDLNYSRAFESFIKASFQLNVFFLQSLKLVLTVAGQEWKMNTQNDRLLACCAELLANLDIVHPQTPKSILRSFGPRAIRCSWGKHDCRKQLFPKMRHRACTPVAFSRSVKSDYVYGSQVVFSLFWPFSTDISAF